MKQTGSTGKMITALVIPAVLLLLFLSPANHWLYEVLIFPCPDPRTPDISADLQQLKKSSFSCREVVFPSANGKLLHGIFCECPGTRRVLLISHGKGNNMYLLLQKARIMLGCGASVFMYDYQGFGRSQGRPSIEGTCEDGIAAYDYLVKHEQRRGSDIIAIGESWGSGVTGQLASRRPLAGVIMHSGFSSLPSAGRSRYFWLRFYPDCCFLGQKMDNVAVFSKPHPPLLIVHGKTDTTIPFQEAERLYEKACTPKSVVWLENGHCCYGKRNEYGLAVRKFLEENAL
jgi:uncharacterized protein